MKIIVHGPAAGPDHNDMITSWGPDQPVEIDDGDKKAVAWARKFAGTPLATLVEDAPEDPPKRGPGRPSNASRAAAAAAEAASAE